MASNLPTKEFAVLLVIPLLISLHAFPQQAYSVDSLSASELLTKVLSRDTLDDEWSAAEKRFEALPTKVALHVLFPEVAKGIPGGFSYAAYNCSDPLHDRKVPGWGEFCVVNWLWCKQLACLGRRNEVSTLLLEFWSHPISFYGHMVLLQGLCRNPDAESRIAKLFRDSAADVRLRMEAAVCLLFQDGTKFHREVVAFAEPAPLKFSQPGLIRYDINLRQGLFDELASRRHLNESGVDAAVVRMGFELLLGEAEEQQKARRYGQIVSEYGQFIYADRLNIYLGMAFEPDRTLPLYAGSEGNERFWHDTVANALDWWSKHERQYMQ